MYYVSGKLVFFLSFSNTAYHQGTKGSAELNFIIYSKYHSRGTVPFIVRHSRLKPKEKKEGQTADRPDGLKTVPSLFKPVSRAGTRTPSSWQQGGGPVRKGQRGRQDRLGLMEGGGGGSRAGTEGKQIITAPAGGVGSSATELQHGRLKLLQKNTPKSTAFSSSNNLTFILENAVLGLEKMQYFRKD
jgi:hypothetical protein